ncbi:DUF4236 domain-containing protein [Actinomycetospora endophytica]|uniref:DUF4236 domain-containing protein n=1 Tax=Actinomycetospora endophytica TaxID=2291215 RepID=UPI0035575AA3
MGFYLRRSIGLGPMRVSVSTRGLGASIGVPGLRVGAGPRGAYVSLANGVVTYRATTRMRAGAARTAPTTPAPAPRPSEPAAPAVVPTVESNGRHRRARVR